MRCVRLKVLIVVDRRERVVQCERVSIKLQTMHHKSSGSVGFLSYFAIGLFTKAIFVIFGVSRFEKWRVLIRVELMNIFGVNFNKSSL